MIACGPIYAQSPDNSPLKPDEGRLILGQLGELTVCRSEIDKYRDFAMRDAEQDERDRQLHKKELDLKDDELALKQKEIDLALEKANLWKGLYDSIKKGPGFWCKFKRVLFLGMARCQ